MNSNQAVIVDAVRTPVGRYAGGLASVRPDDLAAHAIAALLARNPALDPAAVEDVVLGCANQAGEDNRNVARMALLLAGVPQSVAGATVNRLCGSGLMAINQCAQAIAAGEGECFIAGGVESMSRAPFVIPKAGTAFSRHAEIHDTTIGWRFTNPRLAAMHPPYGMGETAENVAERYRLTREEQDRFAQISQQRAGAAHREGRFADELVAVEIPQRRGDPVRVEADEHPRPDITLEQLAKLPAVFRDGGTVTAGNSSGVNDGAAAVLVMSEAAARAAGLTPRARVLASAVAGAYMASRRCSWQTSAKVLPRPPSSFGRFIVV